jgi:thioredoxin-related protein
MRKLMNLLMLSCKQASFLADKKSISPLTRKEKVMLAMHKSMCKYCTAFEKQSMAIDNYLQVYLTGQVPLVVNHELKLKIIERLK